MQNAVSMRVRLRPIKLEDCKRPSILTHREPAEKRQSNSERLGRGHNTLNTCLSFQPSFLSNHPSAQHIAPLTTALALRSFFPVLEVQAASLKTFLSLFTLRLFHPSRSNPTLQSHSPALSACIRNFIRLLHSADDCRRLGPSYSYATTSGIVAALSYAALNYSTPSILRASKELFLINLPTPASSCRNLKRFSSSFFSACSS